MMNFDAVQEIADAVLYEGYLLYPYRPTSVKNQQRWTFGGVYPEAYSTVQRGADACVMRTECLATGDDTTGVTLRVRFLRLITRSVGMASPSAHADGSDAASAFHPMDAVQVGDRVYRPSQEAAERAIDVPRLALAALATTPVDVPFAFPASRTVETLYDAANNEAAMVVRTHEAINGVIAVGAERLDTGVFKLSMRVENRTPLVTPGTPSRDDALPRTFISTHMMMGVENGAFVSLMDPPTALRDAAAGCENVGTWPVLVGEEGDRSLMLSSPIILYDYPQIAPESATSLFDGTEIDEILMLRIMTLTDDEKREIQQSDVRGRDVLARTDAIPPEQFRKLHGVLRGLRTVAEDVL